MLRALLQFSSCLALAALCVVAYVRVMHMAHAGASDFLVISLTLVISTLFVACGTGAVYAWEPKNVHG
ncbi:putative effector of murein hydrolase LrgA (UPF0299 family) [Comamonas odontotermitis]|uniref:Effector of murein hydrolase LrgA (UPF0299 family) n=1 Tax=Comamonas odontotermitis TaxID=379895 RepID=A0ABR6RII1_9BURK|nr:putative effector of murein hydrolase LrgA (UPF0299 family) [Comamonas odontotermitis]